MVIKDPANPANDGKVFLYQYGKKIFDKINEAMHPEFEDEKAYNPFDFWDGANFRLKIRKFEGYRNYDKSEFEDQSALSDDDKYIESIWKQEYPLQDFLSPDKFKSYDELKARLAKVLGMDATSEPSEKITKSNLPKEDGPKQKSTPAPTQAIETSDSEEVDDFFASLNED